MRLLLVDDHPFIRMGLRHVLQSDMNESDLVVDEADSFETAMELIREHNYEIVTVDITLSGKSGIHLLKQIKEERPLLPVLVISTHGEDQYALHTLKLGAAGYLSKHSAAEELLSAIRQIMSTGKYISPIVALLLAETLCVKTGAAELPHTLLSQREMEVACMLAQGQQLKAISHELGLSIKTVSTYRTRLLAKLNLNNNVALANYFTLNKLIR